MRPPDAAADRPLAVVIARPALATLVGLVLRHCTLETIVAEGLESARELARIGDVAVLLVEVARVASAVDLFTLPRRVPTVALIALESGGSSFAAFAAGADQVVRVPFTPDELAIRAAGLVRRTGHRVELVRDQPVDGLEISLDERVVVGDRSVPLDPMANSALFLLLANRGRHVTRDELRALVWGIGSDTPNEAVDRELRSLTRRLGPDAPLRLSIDALGATAAIVGHERPS